MASTLAWAGETEPKLLKECPNGKLYQVGQQKLMLLTGTPYQMGYAHGTLMKDEVQSMTKRVLAFCRISDLAREKNLFAGSIEEAYRRTAPFIPKRYQQEMAGLAKASGVSLRDVRFANIFPALFHCSGFAMFGKATKDGQLLHGRVLDYMTQLGLQENAVTIIAKPKGYNAFVNVSYSGFIGSVTGMNEKQIAIGEMGGRGEGQWDGVPMPMLFRMVLEEADTLNEAVEVFKNTPRTCEYYYVISDGKIPDARGLHCTPEEVLVLEPGEKNPQLSEVIDDVVAFSGPDRLKALMKRIRAEYGKITPAKAIRLMDRPVCMESNLHNALFAPETLELWVAHAISPAEPKYIACWQKYEHYDMGKLMKLMPKPQPVVISGVVPATVVRPIRPANDPEMAERLKTFEVKPEAFKWTMAPMRKAGNLQVYSLKFPSPVVSPDPENNTVHCEYFPALGKGKKTSIIVLHGMDGTFLLERLICRTLASNGVNALLLKMPYYGERRPANKSAHYSLTNPKTLAFAVTQTVKDTRRAARWLASRPETDSSRIGLVGISLGGLIGSLTTSVDGGFPRVALIVAGGNIAQIITNPSRETRGLRKGLADQGITAEALVGMLMPIEPLNFASRLRQASVLMLNATSDNVIPPACSIELQKASNAQIFWYDANHYTMLKYLPIALTKVLAYFKEDKWD